MGILPSGWICTTTRLSESAACGCGSVAVWRCGGVAEAGWQGGVNVVEVGQRGNRAKVGEWVDSQRCGRAAAHRHTAVQKQAGRPGGQAWLACHATQHNGSTACRPDPRLRLAFANCGDPAPLLL